MKGLRVLVTAGPTREYLDPVRFLSNPSTGQMGYALAAAAREAGAQVTLISGPTALETPKQVNRIDVISAADMYRETTRAARNANIIFMSAAVADYCPERRQGQKIKKDSSALHLRMVRTRDVLAALGRKKTAGQYIVGFAAETRALITNARAKLERKNCDMMVANEVKAVNAFGSTSNEVTVLFADGTKKKLARMTKEKLAQKLIQIVKSSRSKG